MSDDNALEPTEQRLVNFDSDKVIAVKMPNDEVFVPLRHMCELLGVAWPAQRRKLNNDPIYSKYIQSLPIETDYRGATRAQAMVCLPLEYLNGWLFGINANRVKPELRPTLRRYQENCHRVLNDAFRAGTLDLDHAALQQTVTAIHQLSAEFQNFGDRLQALEAKLGDTGRHVSQDQAQRMSEAVKAVAFELGNATGRNEYQGVYMEMYRRYGIPSYRELPATKFDDCMNWLRQWYESVSDNDVQF